MTFADLGALGEFIGAIGVIVTLAYLAVQIRQNTRAVRSQIHQARSDQAQQFFLFVAGSKDFASIFNKVDHDPQNLVKLDEVEHRQYLFYAVAAQQRVRNMYDQMQMGFLSPEMYQGQGRVTRRWIPVWKELGILVEEGDFGEELRRIRDEGTGT